MDPITLSAVLAALKGALTKLLELIKRCNCRYVKHKHLVTDDEDVEIDCCTPQ